MSISYDGKIGIGNLEVDDLIGLTQDEIRDLVAKELPDLSPAEVEDLTETYAAELERIEDELKALQDGYEDDLDDTDTPSGQALYERKLDEVNEVLDALDGVEEGIEAALDHELLLNYDTSEDVTWSTANLINGDTVNMNLTGGQDSGIFTEEAEEEVPLTDLNGDGFITYADEEMRVSQAQSEVDPFAGQDLFLDLQAGETIELLSSNGVQQSFKVTTSDGQSFTLNVTGDVKIYFQGTDYLNEADLASWPEDLLKRCYDNDDPLSMYDRTHADETTDAEKLSYISGYDDAVSQENFNSICSQFGFSGSYDDFKTVLDSLYAYLNDTDPDKSINEVWNNLFSTTNPSADTLSAAILAVAIHGEQSQFTGFFGTRMNDLITRLGYDPTQETEPDSKYKSVIMLLTTQITSTTGSAPTELAGSGIWGPMFASVGVDGTGIQSGIWEDHAGNVEAINDYKDMLNQIDWAAWSGMEDSALKMENDIQEDIENGEVPLPEEESLDELSYSVIQSSIANKYANIFGTTGVLGSDGINQGTLENHLSTIVDNINIILSEGGKTAEDIASYILLTIKGLQDNDQDNVAAALSVLLKEEWNDLWVDLKKVPGFMNSMWGYIDNGGDKPLASSDGYDKDYFENLYGKEF